MTEFLSEQLVSLKTVMYLCKFSLFILVFIWFRIMFFVNIFMKKKKCFTFPNGFWFEMNHWNVVVRKIEFLGKLWILVVVDVSAVASQ